MLKTSPVEIKICGLTNASDACLAAELGADYLGLVFFARSPRAITAAQAQAIHRRLPPAARLVGVFVDDTRENVLRTAEVCALHAVQLHGDEHARDFTGIPFPVWRAVHCRPDGSWQPDPAMWPAARYVVDSFHASRKGGTGITADWPRARMLAGRYPCMLAGGLTPDNVTEAILQTKPLGVDVASGIEKSPGRKDQVLMRRFIAAARAIPASSFDEVHQ